jgi:ABC-type multidrug transport system fused ATPase/permease subunit
LAPLYTGPGDGTSPVITPEVAFTLVSLFGVVAGPFIMVPFGIAIYVQFTVACARYDEFFGEVQRPRQERGANRGLDNAVKIRVQNGKFKWNADPPPRAAAAADEDEDDDDDAPLGAFNSAADNDDDDDDDAPLGAALNSADNGDDDDDDAPLGAAPSSAGASPLPRHAPLRPAAAAAVAAGPKPAVLTDINMQVCAGQLVAVVGTVGSGKSSLVNAVLEELVLLRGR